MKNKRVILNWILMLSWMLLIFCMSHQPGEVSSKQSDLVVKIFTAIGIDLNSSLGNLATLVVRKSAHFLEYFILYFLTARVLKSYMSINKSIVYSLIIVLGYAFSDEIHQYFIPGRAMALQDVFIDFSGGVFASIIHKVFVKLKVNRESKYVCKKVFQN